MSSSPDYLFQIDDLVQEGRRHPVFGPLSWAVPEGQRAVFLGEQGTGRSALLLALGGRLKGVQGTIATHDIDGRGFDGVTHPRVLRRNTAVARITDLAELESSLTVGESRDEKALIEGLSIRAGRRRFARLSEQIDFRFDPEEVVEHLPAVHKTLLAAMLGCLRPARWVLLDDLDDSLNAEQLTWMHEQLDLLLALGHTFLVSTTDPTGLTDRCATLQLFPHVEEEPEPVLRRTPLRDRMSRRQDAPTHSYPTDPGPEPSDARPAEPAAAEPAFDDEEN